MKCMHALKLHTRNRRIHSVLLHKAQKLHNEHVQYRAMRIWISRALPTRIPDLVLNAPRYSAAKSGYFVRLKGNVGMWQQALRAPLQTLRTGLEIPGNTTSNVSSLGPKLVPTQNSTLDLIDFPSKHQPHTSPPLKIENPLHIAPGLVVDQDNRLFFRVSHRQT